MTVIIALVALLVISLWGLALWLNARKANKTLEEIARHLRNQALKSDRQDFLRSA